MCFLKAQMGVHGGFVDGSRNIIASIPTICSFFCDDTNKDVNITRLSQRLVWDILN